MNELSTTLNQMLRRSGKSVNQVAQYGGVDRAYLTRLLSGEKTNPSTETLLRIYLGLVFDPKLAQTHPTMVHGLAELSLAASMSQAASLADGD
jgi:transcriptional regulator with XRE-family HTH domain